MLHQSSIVSRVRHTYERFQPHLVGENKTRIPGRCPTLARTLRYFNPVSMSQATTMLRATAVTSETIVEYENNWLGMVEELIKLEML